MRVLNMPRTTVDNIANELGLKVTSFSLYRSRRSYAIYSNFGLRPKGKVHYRRVDARRYLSTGRITRSPHICWHGYRQFVYKAFLAGRRWFETPYGIWNFTATALGPAMRRHDSTGDAFAFFAPLSGPLGLNRYLVRQFCFCNPALLATWKDQNREDEWGRAGRESVTSSYNWGEVLGQLVEIPWEL